MRSWDTNPENNRYENPENNPHWIFICHSKWHPGTLEIPRPPEIAVRIHFHAWHGTETTLIFIPADGEASWSFLLSGSEVQPQNTYSFIVKETSQALQKPKKDEDQH